MPIFMSNDILVLKRLAHEYGCVNVMNFIREHSPGSVGFIIYCRNVSNLISIGLMGVIYGWCACSHGPEGSMVLDIECTIIIHLQECQSNNVFATFHNTHLSCMCLQSWSTYMVPLVQQYPSPFEQNACRGF